MEKSIRLLAYAKVNLSLNITGFNGQKHSLDSIMCSVDTADTVIINLTKTNKINVSFDDESIDKINNSAYKAACIVKDFCPDLGVDIIIQKSIPVMGGMGGSSADAAAVLVGLNELLQLGKQGFKPALRALDVGSDVPFMICGGAARVKATGEDIFYFKNNCRLFIVAASIDTGILTAECYKQFDKLYPDFSLNLTDNDLLFKALINGENLRACSMFSNALFKPACALNPMIENVYQRLLDTAPLAVNMTGSGSFVCAYYDDIDLAQKAYFQISRTKLFRTKFMTFVNEGVQFF